MPHKYKPYPRYKDSGVEWLGDVPRGWSAIPVGRVYNRTKRTGYQDKELLSVYRDHGVVPKSSRDDNNNKPSDDLSPYQLVKQNDLVLNKMKTWQGSIAVSKYEGIVSPAYYVYAPTKKLFDVAHSEYVHFLMRTPVYIAQYLRYSKGIRVNQWDLEPEQFKLIELVLPSKDEQQSIASFLAHETGKIDELIEKQQKLIELLEEKRQTVISHAVTKGLNPNAPMKDSGIEWLEDIPEHWDRSKLGFETTVKARLGWKGLKAEEYVTDSENSYVFLATPNIKNDVIDFNNVDYISARRYFESPEIMLDEGDVLVTKDGSTTGTTNVIRCLPRSATVNSSIAVIRPNSSLFSIYLFYFFKADYIQNIINLKRGGMGVPHLFQADLRWFNILLPPPEEQQQIADYLDKQTTEIDKLVSKAKSAIELMRERRFTLISAAVTGKIDVRDFKTTADTNLEETSA